MTRTTDVPASLAGFYFQLLLACKELVLLINNHDNEDNCVAVERGADVKVFRDANTCIEAKFYKDKAFTRNHASIRHTIYNFYNNFIYNKRNCLPLNTYVYKTNVMISPNHSDFFYDWNNRRISQFDEYYQYIKDCIIFDYVDRDPYAEAFEKYKTTKVLPRKKGKYTKTDYVNVLLEDLHNRAEEYSTYADIISTNDLKEFIHSIQFAFSDEHRKKVFALDTIRNEITTELQKYDSTLTLFDCEKLRNFFIEEFFYTDRVPSISVKNAKEKIANHHTILTQLFEDGLLDIYIKGNEQVINSFSLYIDRRGFAEHKEDLLCNLIKLQEEFYNEIHSSGMMSVNSRFLLDVCPFNPYLLGELFRSMVTLGKFADVDCTSIRFSHLDGINNFGFNNESQYCLKASQRSECNDDFGMLLTAFIDDCKNTNIRKIIGTEKVVFQTPNKPCEYPPMNFDLLIADIATVVDNIEYQHIFKSLEYKCIDCLKLDSAITHKVKCFIEEDCHGKNNPDIKSS